MNPEALATIPEMPGLLHIPELLLGFVIVMIALGASLAFRILHSGQPLKYRRGKPLLSRGEAAFYKVLRDSIPRATIVFAKVRLADIIEVDADRRKKGWIGAFNKINRKHVDFVLCEDVSFAVVCVIELDDKSHRLSESRKSDLIKDKALAQAGIPLLRIPSSRSYSRSDLFKLIGDSCAKV